MKRWLGSGWLILWMLTGAAAQAAPPALGSGNKPIEITSDTLEVMQETHKAIFSGHVVAIQGDMRLKADRMIVHYRQQEQKGKQVPDKQEQGAVSKIEAEGNVFMSTPKETASGARGVYDVDTKIINLYNQVVLTRDQNVLKGDTLTYNLASGQSKVTGAASAAQGKSPARVRALFVPEKNNDSDKKP